MTNQPTPLSPEVVSAILRDESSPLYPSQISVYCDDCGITRTGEYMVSEDMTKAERLNVARTHLRAAGWRCDEYGDICPACKTGQTLAAVLLSDAEREFLTFALDTTADHMATFSDGFTAEDDTAMATLRKLAAGGEQPATSAVLAEVAVERGRQDTKFGEQNHPDRTGPRVPAIVGRLCYAEEAARDARRACQSAARRGETTWRDVFAEEALEALAESDPARLRAELLQVAAVAVAWIEAIDRRAGGA